MAHDIQLVAIDNRYSSSYLPLIEKIKQHFPQFKHQYYDTELLEEVFDGSYGTNSYTKEEIIQKGLGVKLEAEFYDGTPKKREIKETDSGFMIEIRHEDWIEISFWDNGNINLEVPNYPHREISLAMTNILSVVRFLEHEGFALDHPTEDRVIPKVEVEAFLYQSYLNRQMQVDRVRKIVSEP